MEEHHYLVPAQQQGIKKDLAHSITTDTVEDAEYWFVDAKERLLDVNHWEKFGSIADAGFSLTDIHGKRVSRHARKGDHIIINIGETANGPADEYLVVIDTIEYDDYPDTDTESFAMHITHVSDLLQSRADSDAEGVNDASGTLVVVRRNKHLTACYHGRNEKANIEAIITEIDTVPPFDYWMGLPGSTWAQVIKGFIEP